MLSYNTVRHRYDAVELLGRKENGISSDDRASMEKDQPLNMAGSHDFRPFGDTKGCQSRRYKMHEAHISLPSSELASSAA